MNGDNYHPLVSIALTTFNGRNFLREQLDSILSQTYQNYEVVMSDDGSDQETLDILEEYCAKDSRFRWSRSPLARGYRKNTQNAISLCKGDIIVLCDQDDVWFPNKLQSHVNAYRDPKVMWAFNRFVITDQNGKHIGYIEESLPDYYRHKTMLENVWGTCIGAAQTSYRADIIKRTLPIPDYCPAHDSWIQFAIYPAKPYFIDEIVNTYRQHTSNEVGVTATRDILKMQELERESIEANYFRLKMYARESHLPFWKRAFVATVYILKKIRYILRRVVGKTDAKLA